MKKFELTLAFFKLPLDYILIVAAGFTAYSLRFTDFVVSIRPVLFNIPWSRYWPIVLIVALGWVIIFAFSGLYNTNPNRKLARDLSRIVLACSTGFAGITIYVFFTLQKFDSRFLVLAGWILAIIYVCAGRIFLRLFKMLCYRLGIGLRRVVIVGNENITNQIREFFLAYPAMGYSLMAVYEHFDTQTSTNILNKKPDEIIFADPKAREDEALLAIDFAMENNITFKYSADLFPPSLPT